MQIVTGSGQSGVVGTELAQPIVVSVKDTRGNPTAGIGVTWTITAGGGSVTPVSGTTDNEGRASARWTLGTAAGANGVTATVTGVTPAAFTASAVAGPAAQIEKTGDAQRGPVAATLSQPIVARVVDQYGNPIVGAHVAWDIVQGSGAVTTTPSTTDADGRTSTQWTLGPVEGENRVTASVGATATTFTATAVAASGDVQLAVQVVAVNLSSPLYLTTAPIDDRLFVVEETGKIRIIKDGALLATPFLDLTSKLSTGGERGLLSMAFHPAYASNRFFYVFYTDANADVRIERYTVSANPDVADPSSAKPILIVQHRAFNNHNGGLVRFGADGMLYIGIGDGGGNLDPNGQDRSTLLGKLLRIDVDHGDPYAIPPDNPFVGTAYRGEIWAYGLRNPWRWSFDLPTERLYLADVGQSLHEEVNAVGAREAGVNYGWNIMEGASCYLATTCNQTGLQLPVLDYDHSQGSCSVIGGHVYRGVDIPEITGHYFYSDFCTGWLRSFRLSGGVAVDQKQWSVGNLGNVTSFGVDRRGEMYITASGQLFKIVRGG